MKKKNLFPIIFFLFLLSIPFNGNTNLGIFTEQNDLSIPIDQINVKTAYNPIIGLYSDSEMDTYFTSNGTDGTSWAEAYILRDLVFDGSPNRTCIEFETTSRYVIIDNCTFKNAKEGQYGILLDQANNTLVNNSRFYDCDWGVHVYSGENATVKDCEFVGNNFGIECSYYDFGNITSNSFNNNNNSVKLNNVNYVSVSNNDITDSNQGIVNWVGENNEILNNTISNIAEDGIYTLSASEFYSQSILVANNNLDNIGGDGIEVAMWFCTIENNTLNNIGSDGIRILASDNNIINNTITDGESNGIYAANSDLQIKNNTISNFEEYGIYLGSTYTTTDCQYNKLFSCGFYVGFINGDFVIDETNKVNNKPVHFDYDNATVNISSTDIYGQIILNNCSDAIIDSVTTSGIIIVDSNSISLTNCIVSESGILMRFSNSSSIANCNVSSSAITLYYCYSSSIINCEVTGSDLDGFDIQNCPNIIIDSCDVSTTGRNGISLYGSNYSTIKYNEFNDMPTAVRIGYSDFSNILNCQIQNCDDFGVKMEFSDNVTVTNCEISNGGLSGIDISESESVTIVNTLIDTTSGSGIFAGWNSKFLEIQGCTIRNNPDNGITIRLSDFKITDNFLEDNIESGITIDNYLIGGDHNFIIEDNTIKESDRGIDLMYVCEIGGNGELIGNIIENCTYGIQTGFSNYITAELNTITDCEEGMRLSGGDDYSILYNLINYCDWGIIALDNRNIEISHNLINNTNIGISYTEISGEIRNNTIYYYEECISGYTSLTLVESDNSCKKVKNPDNGNEINGFSSLILLIFGSVSVLSILISTTKRRKK